MTPSPNELPPVTENIPSPASGFRALSHNRSFLALWSGQLVAQIGDKIFFVLLISLLEIYHANAGMANSMRSLVMIAFTLPAILFGSAAGIFVDRVPKKRILIGANIIRAIFLILLAVLPKQFLILLGITFIVSTVTQFFAPAEQSAIALSVPREGLMSANSLFTVSTMGALIVGMAIGEPILSWTETWGGVIGKHLVVSVLYFIAAFILLGMRVKEPAIDPSQLALHPFSDLKAGFRYLQQNPLVRNAMVQLTVLYSVLAALTVLAIDLAADIGLRPTQFGFLLAASGVGMLLGAAILGGFGDRFSHKPVPLIGFLTIAFALCLFAFTTQIFFGLALSALLGIGGAFVVIPMQTLIQYSTPEAMRGKVFGFSNNAVNIALSLPLAIAGPLTDIIGLRFVLWGMSLGAAFAGLWAWANTRRVLEKVI
ncbi:MFS transporter [Desertifilum sp. FACHB-1129]|uniref:MFS transporter n=1 Tax=Desertifilum tharense IPPAS B-1220 TaxID=1781255 RepID=A0A1E5QIT9_9CYAN|nr:MULTISPECIES: MFS transporter [Desertifilum]MDA0212556.1 MFS transporter [Cyanobacteria bacterium FC1]MBD2315051.1 MFS transporter [Desertifilum sp. FACHB-1129]MBD2324974.1 MFS transporter [Desertifilum sp. FACHB-866]MBD2335113.1 MFS transporter [Desertifilum sp. FACHB-868]OEJ74599.1 MFS transporter [Desertifilum tharense IPPAS B-1220]